MLTIYHKPHSQRNSELAFVEALQQRFPKANYRAENYPIAPSYLNKCVQTRHLLAALDEDEQLPPKPRANCRAILANCPSELQITHDPKRISFDVVITDGVETYYWEYHENQHRRLTIDRTKHVYDGATGAPIIVPRYLQRLVRDIWRLQYFRPYTIVWQDWFKKDRNSELLKLQSGLNEYVLPQKFSFITFYRSYLSK